MLHDPDPGSAAALRSTGARGVGHPRLASHPRLDSRYTDPDFALAFARLVTHYIRNDEFLEDGMLLRDAVCSPTSPARW